MHKPRYMEELLKIIFLWLGMAFLLMGLLCFLGLLKPTAGSALQSSAALGSMFSLLGLIFFITQLALKAIVASKNKLRHALLQNGAKLNGTVEKVYLQRYTQYKNASPYRILYSYTYEGKVYHHKSHLIWDKPSFTQGDTLTVYANGAGKSTVLCS